MKKSTLIVASFLGLLVAPPALAYDFRPTDAEWYSWPGRCKAVYVTTVIGMDSKWAGQVSSADVAEHVQWKQSGIGGLHHFCAGTIWLQRAKRQADESRRSFELKTAIEETRWTMKRSNEHSPMFPTMLIQPAMIMYEQGELHDAIQLLQGGLSNHPQSDILYSAIGTLQWRLGELRKAKETLLQGFEAVDGKSAEINYNLGLILVELGELDEAVKHAKLAYELDYPLPGLRSKLQKLNRM